jgi:hypothetical protein
MPIPTTGSVEAEIAGGTQLRWRIANAEFRPYGKFGPEVTLKLEVANPDHAGVETIYSAAIQRPRLDKVARLEKEGLKPKAIAEILREQGYHFDKIDEPDTLSVARGGNLYKILLASCGGDRVRAELALQKCDGFDELAEKLVGGTFVGTTKLSDKGYVRLDGNEEIFPDLGSAEEVQATIDEELDELPDFDEDDPAVPF